MHILILGGTAWLGQEIARNALGHGHRVSCLARGESGSVVDGAALIRADRSRPGAYDAVMDRDWDAVMEVSWQPGMVRGALTALHERAGHWTYVSSVSAYTERDDGTGDRTPHGTDRGPERGTAHWADESAALLEPTALDSAGREQYGAAKVACENSSRQVAGGRLLVARAGLIGGPGDHTGRTGYWVARAARAPRRPMLVPDAPGAQTQVIDVRDLAGFLVRSAGDGTTGTFDTVGPAVPFDEWIGLARVAGRHTGPVVRATPDWLARRRVNAWMGPESLPLWTGHTRVPTRLGTAAVAAGLRHRERSTLMADLLAWERAQGLDRPRGAGLTDRFEQELLAELGG